MEKNEFEKNPYFKMESVLSIMGDENYYEWGVEGNLFNSPLLRGIVNKVKNLPQYQKEYDNGFEPNRIARAILTYLIDEQEQGYDEILTALYLTCEEIYNKVKEKHDVELNSYSDKWYFKEYKTISEQNLSN